MKDKIVYLVIGILIAVIIMLTVVKTSNLTAQNQFTNENTKVFDNVVIKGKLYVGVGKNRIVLQTDDASNIILESQGSVVSIVANPETSSILITSDIVDHKAGLELITTNQKSLISMKDVKGIKYIETKDKN